MRSFPSGVCFHKVTPPFLQKEEGNSISYCHLGAEVLFCCFFLSFVSGVNAGVEIPAIVLSVLSPLTARGTICARVSAGDLQPEVFQTLLWTELRSEVSNSLHFLLSSLIFLDSRLDLNRLE